jgi:glutamyl/glutaminyl-tRNA synthetase
VPLAQPPTDALRQLEPGARGVLEAARSKLADCAWQPADISAAVKAAGKQVGAAGRALFEPIRIAVTGEPHGPPLGAVLYVQGREPVLTALGRALEIAT